MLIAHCEHRAEAPRDLVQRYLTPKEHDVYEGLSIRRRRQWLAGRVAAKNAVCDLLRRKPSTEPVSPRQFSVVNDTLGAPKIEAHAPGAVPWGLHLSIAHKSVPGGILAGAIVGEHPVGIDLETIAPREEGFLDLAFSEAERSLLAGDDLPSEYTRGWVAKEVAAKASGYGLRGAPRRYVISAREGEALCANGHWVATLSLGGYVVGWSRKSR